MAADRELPTLADYAVTAISPVLIMLMVGSLVFFLVEVLYAGQYSDRLLYTMFFFVIGAVLVARIAIQIDRTRASMYGLFLGVATFLAMSAYVDYPAGTPLRGVAWLVNIGLMALIWWSANKLTWDCTHIDENRDSSGRGLLSAAGLAQSEGEAKEEQFTIDPEPEPATGGKKKRKKKVRRQSPFACWLTRFQKYRAAQRDKPHTPGVWVIYFSLAALPLFALGQSLIAPDDDERRRATFLQMAAYVGSGLGLLVTTSFLGLRRYLRQRKAKIPAALTARWLGLGAVLIAVFVVVGAFLPRPHSEVPWFGIPRAGKEQREASKYAVLKSGAGKGDGAEGDVTEKGKGSASGKNGEPGGNKGDKGSGGGKGEKGSSGSKSNSGKDSGSGKGKDSNSDGDSKGKDNSKDSSNDKRDPNDKNTDDSNSGGNSKSERDNDDAKSDSRSGNRSDGSSAPKTALGSVLQKIGGVLKWIVFAIVAILVLIGVVLAFLRYLAPFTEWARKLLEAIQNWWANLFGGGRKVRVQSEDAAAGLGPQRPPPFREFSNPFEDGTAERREPEELVVYTFAALDSWAWDREHGRVAAETALEFSARLGVAFVPFQPNLRRLANLYARVSYSKLPLPADTLKLLEQVWDQLVHGVDIAEPAAIGTEAEA